MTTTSGNIAGTPQPFAVTGGGTRPWPYGKARMYKVDEIRPRKKKKVDNDNYGQVGMLYVGQLGEAYTTAVGDGFWKINSTGKIGVWRTIRGKRYFFPSDGSGSTPKIPGGKKKESKSTNKSGGSATPKKKKKGILGAIMSKISGALGGGGGAKASARDVKPKKAKKGTGRASGGSGGTKKNKKTGKTKIPDNKKTLDSVEAMMLKASRNKGGRKLGGALKKMQKALKDDDPKAFKAAEQSLAMATAKLAKKRGG